MSAIKAEVSKEKKSKRLIYSFEVNNNVFKAYFLRTKAPTLEITHNDSLLGKTDRPNEKQEYTVNSETGPVKITAWIDYRYSLTIGYTREVGIEVDGKPVQHTAADPETQILKGRNFLFILLAILLIQSVYNYFSAFQSYSSEEYVMTSEQSLIAAGIVSAIYFIPFLIVLIGAIKYKAWTIFAILSGAIISALETVFFIINSLNSITYGSIIGLLIRIGVLISLCSAYRLKLKLNKAALP